MITRTYEWNNNELNKPYLQIKTWTIEHDIVTETCEIPISQKILVVIGIIPIIDTPSIIVNLSFGEPSSPPSLERLSIHRFDNLSLTT